MKENSHAQAAHATIGAGVSQTILIYQISPAQHFHLDITDKLFILVAVAKSKDLAARNSLSSEGGYLLKQKSTIITVTLTNAQMPALHFKQPHYCTFFVCSLINGVLI